MKNLIKFLVIILIILNAQTTRSQSGILLSESGLSTALEKAKAEKKSVFLMCYMSWCPHCKKMMTKVFKDTAVADFYNRNFICVAQDMGKGDGINLLKSLKINSFPTFVFYDSNAECIYRIAGELTANEFVQQGKNALNPPKQLPYLKKQFDTDTSNADKCLSYLTTLKKAQLDFSGVVSRYFSTQTEGQLLTEKNWRIIANGTTDINSREFQFVLHHQKEYSSIASPERVSRKIFYLVKEILNPLVESKDSLNYFNCRKSVTAIHLFSIDSLVFTLDLKLYDLLNNWNAYQETSLQSTSTYVWNDYMQLSTIATNYLKNINDTNALTQAVRWTQRALVLNEDYNSCFLGSRLYQKASRISDAIQMAQQGKKIAIKYGWDATELDSLLIDLQRIKK